MNLSVTDEAAKWYKEELDIEDKASLRFLVRYGGVGGIQPGFSLAIQLDEPKEPIAETTIQNIRYFVEADDEWYFDGHSLKVEYSAKWDEPDFKYE